MSIIHADVLNALAAMEPQSVHCAVTSPPYYMQRVYEGLEPNVWGDKDCAHEWGVPIPGRIGSGSLNGSTLEGAHPGPERRPVWDSSICRLCSAWRGLLGNEPLADCLAWARQEPPCPVCYVCHMRTVFAAVHRVLRDDSVLWINLGDKYAGSGGAGGDYGENGARNGQPKFGKVATEKIAPKNLYGIPWRVALALQADGWILRSEIIWRKPSAMPQSVRDRVTVAHETVFMFSKSPHYYYDMDAVRTPHAEVSIQRAQPHRSPPGAAERNGKVGRNGSPNTLALENMNHPLGANLRSVWDIPFEPSHSEHYASYPSVLPERCIRLGTSERGVCADCGAPWTRQTERTAMEVKRTDWGERAGNRTASSGTMTKPPTSTTTGWSPSCEHDAPTIPATVLDPFAGTATTGVAALRNGRAFIGIEASAKYVAIAERRLAETQPAWSALLGATS